MDKKMRAIAVVTIVLISVGSAGAYSFTDVDIEAWAESGAGASQEAVCIFNFSDGTRKAFGYRFDPSHTVGRPAGNAFSSDPVPAATGEAMLLALDQQTGLTVTPQYYAFMGFTLSAASFGGSEMVSNWNPDFLGYWLSGAAEYVDTFPDPDVVYPAWTGDGETWQAAPMGPTVRTLRSGDWDGWTSEDSTQGWVPLNEPVVPLLDGTGPGGQEVPEPATMLLFGASLVGLLPALRRRR